MYILLEKMLPKLKVIFKMLVVWLLHLPPPLLLPAADRAEGGGDEEDWSHTRRACRG